MTVVSAKTVQEHPVRRMERVSKQPIPGSLRKALASNLSEKHQTALLEWLEDVIRRATADGIYDGSHPIYDPDPFND